MLKKLGLVCIVGGALVSTFTYVAGNDEAVRRIESADRMYEQFKHNSTLKEMLYWDDMQRQRAYEQEFNARKNYIYGGRITALVGIVFFCLGSDLSRLSRRAIIGIKREEEDATDDRESRP